MKVSHVSCFLMALAMLGSSVEAALVINEVLYDSTTNDGSNGSNGEWFELYNSGPGSVDASNFIITDGDWSVVLDPGTMIGAGEFFLIGYNGFADDLGGTPTFDVDLNSHAGIGGSSAITLTNTGEFLGLFDAGGTMLDGIIWESPSAGNTPGPGGDDSVNLPAGHPLGATLSIPAGGFNTISGNAGNGESIARNIDGGGTWVFSNSLGGNTADATNAPASVPEPPALALMLFALIGVGLQRLWIKGIHRGLELGTVGKLVFLC